LEQQALWETPEKEEGAEMFLSERETVKGVLNPEWVELLMGFPPGYTDGRPAADRNNIPGNPRVSCP